MFYCVFSIITKKLSINYVRLCWAYLFGDPPTILSHTAPTTCVEFPTNPKAISL